MDHFPGGAPTQLHRWASGAARSSAERLKRERLREMLRCRYGEDNHDDEADKTGGLVVQAIATDEEAPTAEDEVTGCRVMSLARSLQPSRSGKARADHRDSCRLLLLQTGSAVRLLGLHRQVPKNRHRSPMM